jgi:hypothetical protein
MYSPSSTAMINDDNDDGFDLRMTYIPSNSYKEIKNRTLIEMNKYPSQLPVKSTILTSASSNILADYQKNSIIR